jgi:hypothetical protein
VSTPVLPSGPPAARPAATHLPTGAGVGRAEVDLTDPASVVLDLSDVDVRDLAHQLAAAHGRDAAPFGTYLLDPGEPAAALARRLECEVFGEVFGNTAALLSAEYEPYEATTRFVCVLDHRRGRAVGAVRLILPAGGPPPWPSSTGAKSLDDLARVWGVPPEQATLADGRPVDPLRTWDIATLAVADGYRRGLVSLALYQACCATASRAGAASFVTIVDVAVLRLLQARLGRPFSPVPGAAARRYLDSPASVPCTCDLREWPRRLAQRDPLLHETLFSGQGLEPAVSRPDWEDLPASWWAVAGPQLAPNAARCRERPAALSTSGTRCAPTGRQNT